MDSATVAAWVAALGAGVAALFAIWSGVSSHRSARSSESAARSAAGALDLERDRRRGELTPQLRLIRDRQGAHQGVWVVNDGPETYDTVRFALIEREGGGAVNALRLGGRDDGSEWVTEGNLGLRMVVGDKVFLRYQRSPRRRGGVLRIRFTCTNDQGEWVVAAECDIPSARVATF
jgi:hypothetical protein